MDDDFLSSIQKFVEETNVNTDEILKTIIMRIGSELVRLSPVDTGRFKGNWQLTVDGTSNHSLLTTDPDNSRTTSKMRDKLRTFTAGQVAYIQNHLLYGDDLEHGSSKQARDPDGMVRVTAAKFDRIVDEAVLFHTR